MLRIKLHELMEIYYKFEKALLHTKTIMSKD